MVVSDGHWNQDQEYQDNHDDALNRIQTIHNDDPLDFLVYNGDIVDDDEAVHLTVINEFFEELPSDIDWYPVFGNHDWSTDEEWEADYGVPKNYTFEYGDYGFIVAETGVPRDAEGPGEYTGADAAFIGDEIDRFEADGKEAVFVFMHISPADTNDDPYASDSADVREELQREIVEATFIGHWHNENRVRIFDDIRYIYANRIGGTDLSSDSSEYIDWGLRLFDIK